MSKEGLQRCFGEQGNNVNFVKGTREQRGKIIGNMGTRNILGNKGTKPLSEKKNTNTMMAEHIVNI